MERFSSISDNELADGIVTWSGRIAAGEAELLALIGEFDHREAWGGVGLLSCAHWLSWRTSLSPSAAREKVRVARALRELPRVQEVFGAGRLSYSQVRAVTRLATPDDQERWIDAARCSTASQLEQLVRAARRVHKVQEDVADPEHAAWTMRASKTYDQDGNAVYRIVLPAEQAAVVDAALEAMQAELDRQAAAASAEASSPQEGVLPGLEQVRGASAEASSPQDQAVAVAGDASAEAGSPQPATLADALVEMARVALEASAAASPAAARRNRSSLVAQIDPVSGWGRLRDGELLPPTSLRAVMTTLPGRSGTLRLKRLTPQDLRLHDLGRSQRLPSLALREFLGTLDGERCRFPGCTRHRKLHAHHVVYWSDGGGTDLNNLVKREYVPPSRDALRLVLNGVHEAQDCGPVHAASSGGCSGANLARKRPLRHLVSHLPHMATRWRCTSTRQSCTQHQGTSRSRQRRAITCRTTNRLRAAVFVALGATYAASA